MSVVAERARTTPNGLAIDDLTRQRTWAEFHDRVCRIARLLRDELGLRPGEHVATLMGNRVECYELMLGAIHAGLWLTPINFHLTEEEIAYVARDSQARALFTDGTFEGAARACHPGPVIRAGAELDARIAAASDEPMPLSGPAGGPLIYTSGTTGYPKGVKRQRGRDLLEVLQDQRRAASVIGLDGGGPHLVTGPCYHSSPLMVPIYDQAHGAPIIVMPRWDAAQALELIMEREIGQSHLVPTMFSRLLRLPEETRAAFHAPALRRVVHGAAPISRRVKEQMIEWWGPILLEYWGATESGMITTVESADWLEHPDTVGRALPAWEVFAADADGKRLPPGENGLLYARHARYERIFEYHGDPEKTAASYLEPYVFHIGDIGRVDADGWVYLADRKSNTIISGGVNIYPLEIENVLQTHPAVADVGVFGVPDDEWGESIKAAVQLAPGHEGNEELVEALRSHVRAHLAGYKVPRSVDFHAQLPRHPSGKLYIRRLKAPYWEGRARQI
jgi:long-chain acyl-CoA synthetase